MWPEQDDGLSSKQKLDGDVRNMLCMLVFFLIIEEWNHMKTAMQQDVRLIPPQFQPTQDLNFFLFVWQEKSNNLDYLIRIF